VPGGCDADEEDAMKLDAHVHTMHSGRTSIWPLDAVVNESYTDPEAAYARAKARGMDLVAITDHNGIDGALLLAYRPDVIVGCEVSMAFPGTRVEAHLGVLDITPAQFVEIEARRHDPAYLLPYLRSQRIFTTLNHPASQVNGRMSLAHLAAVLPWVDAIEGLNGTRLRSQNRLARHLAAAEGKGVVGGSDSHTLRGIGRTYTVVDGARTREEFLIGLRAGRGRAEGADGSYFTMASDIVPFAGGFYRTRARRIRRRLDWRAAAAAIGSPLLSPVLPIALVGALGHFLYELRFARTLRLRLEQASAGAVAASEPA
jgi:predicted metal-dependent phosphoesterase TrpH